MPALRAKVSFRGPDRRVITAGTLIDSKDPVVKGREALFEVPDDVIEAATAAPGEKRTARSTTRKKAAPKDTE